MLKIVVFDSGYGGELFADYLEKVLPVVEIIRVIDWRHADKIQNSPRAARRAAQNALGPYIGRADLIVFANHLLTITSLKYFKRRYKNQRFTGLSLSHPCTFKTRSLILTTRAVTRTVNYYNYKFQLRHKSDTLCLDAWPALIDDGELTLEQIKTTLRQFVRSKGYIPDEIILGCSQFCDIKTELRLATNYRAKVYDGFDDAVSQICRMLRIRGGTGRKRR